VGIDAPRPEGMLHIESDGYHNENALLINLNAELFPPGVQSFPKR
jgi:hypothetical protein